MASVWKSKYAELLITNHYSLITIRLVLNTEAAVRAGRYLFGFTKELNGFLEFAVFFVVDWEETGRAVNTAGNRSFQVVLDQVFGTVETPFINRNFGGLRFLYQVFQHFIRHGKFLAKLLQWHFSEFFLVIVVVVQRKFADNVLAVKLGQETAVFRSIGRYKYIGHNADAAINQAAFAGFVLQRIVEMNAVGVENFAVLETAYQNQFVIFHPGLIRFLNRAAAGREIPRNSQAKFGAI